MHSPIAAPAHRTAKGAQRIQDLIEAAAERFLEQGFDAVAVDDLIARVGGSRRNVYSHFGNKQGLFEAAMMHVCNGMARPLDAMVIEGREVGEVLPAFGRELVLIALSPRTLAVHRLLTTEGGRFPGIAQAMLGASYSKIVHKLANWIAERQSGAAAGLAGDIPAQSLAEQFISMTSSDIKLRAIVGLVQAPVADAEIDRIVHNAVRTFLHGASAAPLHPPIPLSHPTQGTSP